MPKAGNAAVSGESVVTGVPCNDTAQPTMLLLHRIVSSSVQLKAEGLQLRHLFLSRGDSKDAGSAPAPARVGADVRESEEVEGFLPSSSSLDCSKLNHPRLGRMQLEAMRFKTTDQSCMQRRDVALPTAPDDEVVGVTNDNDVAPRLFLSPSLHEQVKHTVKIHI